MNPGPAAIAGEATSPARDVEGAPRLSGAEVWLIALAVCAARVLAIRAFPIYDDAFITYRYARNLAEGAGMFYNPGASWEPILGTTTPGYALILAGLSAVGLPIVATSLAVNVLCDLVSAWFIAALLDRRTVSTLVALTAFAAIPQIARISVGGMEPPVVLAASLGAVLAFQRGKYTLAGVAAAVACTLRPECVLLVLTLAGFAIFRREGLLKFLLPVALIGAVTIGLLTWTYGTPIAHSITAKAAVHAGEQKPGFSRIPDILAQAFGPSNEMRLLIALVGIGALVILRRRAAVLPFVAFTALVVAAYLIAQPKTWGWYFYSQLAAWVICLGMGFEQIARWVGHARLGFRQHRFVGPWVALGVVASIGAVCAFPLLRSDRVTPRVYRRFEEWAKEYRIEERQASILASDIGAVGWYANTLIYDSAGLVWPDALSLPRQVDQIAKYDPDYAVLVVRRSRLKPFLIDSPELAAKYRPIRRFNEVNPTGREKLTPDVSELPDWWEQDYLIFERIRE